MRNAAKPTREEASILRTLADSTYQQTADAHGVSRGKVYTIALAHSARKNEERIRERKAERQKRQIEMLSEMMGATQEADVLDYLDSLPSACADLVVTSIPYNVGVRYGDGIASDAMPHLRYLGWMTMIISDIARILKPGGVVFLQCGSTKDDAGSLVPLDIALFETLRKAGLDYQNRVAWLIPHGLTPRGRLSERHESALIFSKGRPATFNPDPARTPQKQPGKRAFKGANKGQLSGHPFGAWPSDVWRIGNVGHNHPEKTGHPAQFPEELAMRAVQIYTGPGDLVIDPFSGSGTTHVAAKKTGRRFSGADLFYAGMANDRAAAADMDDACILPGVSEESRAVWQAEARSRGETPTSIARSMQEDLFA